MPSEPARKYQRSHRAEESRVGERAVLYHRDSQKAIVLNPTGSWLWQLLATPSTTQALAERLQAQFPSLTPEQAECDTAAFLYELCSHALVLEEE